MRSFLRIALLLLTAAGLSAQDATIPIPATVTLDGLPAMPASLASRLTQYNQFTSAQLLAWHPSRRQMLVSTPAGRVPQIHLVDAPGAPAKPVTSFKEGVRGTVSYAPSGASFVFRKDPGAGEMHQLWRMDGLEGEPVLLTDGKSRNGIPRWSSKGDRIAFDSNRRTAKDFDLYIADPKDPASARLVTEVSGSWYVADWSPDDRTLLAVQMLPGNDTALWTVDVETGTRKPLTQGTPASIWSGAQYAPDGKAIYAVSNRESELSRVWRWRDGTWTPLTRDGDSVESAALSPDGATLAVVFDRDASSRLELLDTTSLKPRVTPALPAGLVTGLQWHPSGAEVGFTFASLQMQGDVFSVEARTGVVTRWTKSPVGGIADATLPDPEIVRWKSFDGRLISGVLYRPAARFTGPRPVIINIHGGPNDARERPRFIGRSAYFLNEMGIAVIYPNVRGSFGFGRTFEKLDDGRKREDAVKDVGALLDWIGQQTFLDAKRVMVTGASYGGYMTYAVAQHYPDRIRCAYAAAGISNFVTYLENTDPRRQEDRRGEYGDERDPAMREFLTGISPVTQAARIRVPLMIAHGRQDTRVPIAQMDAMVKAARANNVPVWTLVFENAGHDNFPATAVNNDFTIYAWITFAEKFLLN